MAEGGIRGFDIHKIAGYGNEEEVTIGDGFNYKVISITYNKDKNTWYVELEQIAD